MATITIQITLNKDTLEHVPYLLGYLINDDISDEDASDLSAIRTAITEGVEREEERLRTLLKDVERSFEIFPDARERLAESLGLKETGA